MLAMTQRDAITPSEPGSGGVLLEAQGLAVGRGGDALLPPLNHRFEGSQLTVLFGPNGGGKSTLLETLAGRLPAITGNYVINDGVSRSGVLQQPTLSSLVPMTVEDLVKGGLESQWSFLQPRWLRQTTEVIDEWIARLDLEDLRNRSVHRLSGGQRQRAFFARTLVSEARLVLLDEPTSAMDAEFMRLSYQRMREYATEYDASVLIATHDIDIALPAADVVIFVDHENNELIAGRPEELAARDAVEARYGDKIQRILESRP
jgi:ABC-type Mn2+/Zn2+ transport system ATPase subunit